MRKNAKVTTVCVIATSILIAAILLDLHMAYTPLSLSQTIDGILGRGDYVSNVVVRKINGPRIVMGCFVGAGLALSGAVMQAIFRNPMASPYILGMSSGASFGAALALLFPLAFLPELFSVPACSFIFCFITVFIVYSISKTQGRTQTETLILAGIAVGSMFSAFVSFLTYISGEKMAGIVFWMMGDIGQYEWNNVIIVAPLVLIGCLLMLTRANDLNAMMLGDIHANDLGVNVAQVRKEMLFATALVTAACVSFVGVIGFVGLVIPHIMRILMGPDNRYLLPASIIGGAAFIVLCDYISRSIIPGDILPIGILTSIIGAPYFIYLLIRRKKEMGW
ncbi:MAG: iron ABC transporter permease [Candidatus Methanomethylophilaceae archaeon]